MSELFGIEVGSMSDDELMHKQVELHAKLAWAARFSSGETIAKIQQILSVIELERQERAFRDAFKSQATVMPEIIESDPELASKHKKEVEKPERGNITPVQRPRVMISKTSRPSETGLTSVIEPVVKTASPTKDKE